MELTILTYDGTEEMVCVDCNFIRFSKGREMIEIVTHKTAIPISNDGEVMVVHVWVNGKDDHPLAMQINGVIHRLVQEIKDEEKREAFKAIKCTFPLHVWQF